MCLCICFFIFYFYFARQKHCIMLEYASCYTHNYAGTIRQGLVGRPGSGSFRQGSGSPRRGSGAARLGSGAARLGSGTPRRGSEVDRQGSGTTDSVRVSADQVRVAGVGRPLRDAPFGHHTSDTLGPVFSVITDVIWAQRILGHSAPPCRTSCRSRYRRLWLFSAPRQLGAYYYISAYIITVTRPGLLSACSLNRMLRLEHSLVPRPPRPAFVACNTKSGGRPGRTYHVMRAAADVTYCS